MSKRLTITYGDTILCDTDQVGQFSFTESDDAVSVTAKLKTARPQRQPGGGVGIFDMIARKAAESPRAENRAPDAIEAG